MFLSTVEMDRIYVYFIYCIHLYIYKKKNFKMKFYDYADS